MKRATCRWQSRRPMKPASSGRMRVGLDMTLMFTCTEGLELTYVEKKRCVCVLMCAKYKS